MFHIYIILALTFLGLVINVTSQATQTNITVDSSNSTLDYAGQWVVQNDGQYKFTTDPTASVSLNFSGVAIYWHSQKNPIGGIVSVTLDASGATTVDSSAGYSNISQQAVQAVLFAQEGLHNGPHTIKIQYDGVGSLGGPYVENYYFEYTQALSGNSVGTGGASSTSTAPPTRKILAEKAALIGSFSTLGVVILACFLGVMVLKGRRRRRLRKREEAQARAQPYSLPLSRSTSRARRKYHPRYPCAPSSTYASEFSSPPRTFENAFAEDMTTMSEPPPAYSASASRLSHYFGL